MPIKTLAVDIYFHINIKTITSFFAKAGRQAENGIYISMLAGFRTLIQIFGFALVLWMYAALVARI